MMRSPMKIELTETDAINGRQMLAQTTPRPPLIVRYPAAPRRAAYRQRRARLVHVHAVPVDQVVGVLLRQTFAQHVERPAAIARAADHDLPLDRDAPLILDRR